MNKPPCPKIGIKIRESNNEYKASPFSVNSNSTTKQKTPELCNANNFDLNIDNYSMRDIFHLFNIQRDLLDESVMKEAKKFVLKTHPDKSKLDPKYFLFYSSAYKKLYHVFEFQNKSTKKKMEQEDFSNDSNNKILDNVFTKNEALKALISVRSKNNNEQMNDMKQLITIPLSKKQEEKKLEETKIEEIKTEKIINNIEPINSKMGDITN